jgi:hypothetical protein
MKSITTIALFFVFINTYAIKIDRATVFFDFLYSTKFQSADSTLKRMENECPDKKLVSLLKVTNRWYQLMNGISNDDSIKCCLNFTNRTIEEHNKTYTDNNTCNFYLILLYGYKARLSNMLGYKISGISAFFDGIKYLDKIDTLKTEDKEIYRLIGGMYYCLMGYAYESHPSLFLFTDYSKYANKDVGLKLLKEGSRSNLKFIRIECLYFLVKINSEIEQKPTIALSYLDRLNEQLPENLFFGLYRIQLLQKLGNFQIAQENIKSLKIEVRKNEQLSSLQREYYMSIH